MSTATISCSTPDAIIRYEIGGVDPTESSPLYSAPVEFSGEIKAKAWKDGMEESDIAVSVSTEEEMYKEFTTDGTSAYWALDSEIWNYFKDNKFLPFNIILILDDNDGKSYSLPCVYDEVTEDSTGFEHRLFFGNNIEDSNSNTLGTTVSNNTILEPNFRIGAKFNYVTNYTLIMFGTLR